ncbi:hypothetical protein niasHT_009939 [Heterodera trifolii]|uniref:Protein kinase domain-containing protein n=1 Tax=Heterodera trifolii TaxID=157864 RepID=A0ABD2MD84_9BILA
MAVERGSSDSGGASTNGTATGEGGGTTTASDGSGKPPPKKPPEPTPRPGTPAAPTAVAGGGGGGMFCDPDDQEDDEILEESPCKRWSKRCEKVKQRDVPGIDAAYLAMDNETGNEVVWNEVLFSERKNFREQQEKIRAVFDNLVRLEHPNLVKFHKYWLDTKSDKPRIIFITEYMSSGSMSRFLQRARSSGSLLNIKAWKSWTRQILTALSYLHSCDPPIVHANLTCNSVFIQQNGLVKIGCVAPKTIHHHVKTFRENIKNVHYLAPEYDHQTETTIQADIYSFGVCALEMATTGALQSGCFNGAPPSSMASSASVAPPSAASFASLPPHATAVPLPSTDRDRGAVTENEPPNGTGCSLASAASTGTLAATVSNWPTATAAAVTSLPQSAVCSHVVTQEMVHNALNSLDQPEQKQFIERCLELDPDRRANVTELLDRLGPPEPDPDDTLAQHPQHEDGYNISTIHQQNHHHQPPHHHHQLPTHNFVVSAATTTTTTGGQTSTPDEITTTIITPQPPPPTAMTTGTSTKTTTANSTGGSAGATYASVVAPSTTATTAPSATVPSAAVPTSTAQVTTIVTSTMATNGVGQQQLPVTSASNNNGKVKTAPPTALVVPVAAPDEGYHTNQSIVDGAGGFYAHHPQMTVFGGIDIVSTADSAVHLPPLLPPAAVQQNLETRQVVQLHAELLEPDADGVATRLRIQLQLDDLMNRQLTATLRDGDTGDSLAAELVQNGFVSEENSREVCELLTKVVGTRTLQQQQLHAWRESSSSAAEEQQQQTPAGKAN